MSKLRNKLKNYIRNNDQIVCITCYDAAFAKILNDLNVDIVLVGDSLGMVIKGEHNTHNVNMSDILYHVDCVSKYKKNFILMADMPINSFENQEKAVINAKKMLDKEVDIIKIEYQDAHKNIIEKLIFENIPVCGHLGLQPQYVIEKKDMRTYGKDSIEKRKILDQVRTLEEVGVDLILLECVDESLSKFITETTSTPIIGIGSGENCNGQVQVIYDLIGISQKPPKFAKNYLAEKNNIQLAIKSFYNYVKAIDCKKK